MNLKLILKKLVLVLILATATTTVSIVLWLMIQMDAVKEIDFIYLMVGFPMAVVAISTVQLFSAIAGVALGRTRMRQIFYAFLISAALSALGAVYLGANIPSGSKQIDVMWLGLILVPWVPWLVYLGWLMLEGREARSTSNK